ncbi:beta-ketoacyl-[acyl-carrier-protein] synthase family protein [Rouxiella sp. Mn2063]|uniref:beta-ketoacyl-[acyl-carrier-protein] synthase family protein n=1 Tax=Rouxiella sp. Mn2063 TaxID=3395262 RepID=UPI003BDF1546
MQIRRVVITGVGAITPFGPGVDRLIAALAAGQSGISVLPAPAYRNDNEAVPQIAGRVTDIDVSTIARKHRRTMSPMSLYAVLAAQEALTQAQLPLENINNPRFGIIVGSTMGSVEAYQSVFENYLPEHRFDTVKTSAFFKMMGHTVASNLAQMLGVTGRVMALSAACASGAQSVGAAFEAIACGAQDIMLCGGADELHPLTIATFDLMSAASRHYNDRPECTPRPFDKDRDGVVCSEGVGLLLLESYDSAQQRGATILGEVAGFTSASDTSSIASPAPEPLLACMQSALASARLDISDVSYINAHATGTRSGDIAESQAIRMLCQQHIPVSSLKGHLGHTMAASGAIELIACLAMMQRNTLFPTRNLVSPDEQCQGIQHVQSQLSTRVNTVIKNSFALGGVISSLVLRKL